MGCGNSSPKSTVLTFNQKLTLDKLAFNKRHEVIEKNIGLGIFDLEKILNFGSNNLDQDFETLLKNILIRCDNCGLDYILIKIAILEILSQEFIKEFFEFSDYDILNYAKENIDFLNFYKTPESRDLLKGMINCATRLMPKFQKGLIIKLEENQLNNYINNNTVFNNLKFNRSYQSEMYIIKLNRFSIVDSYLNKLIGESLILQTNLNTLIIDIDDPENKIFNEFIPNINSIFMQIKHLKDLKIFSFRNLNKNDELIANYNIETGILNLLEQDTLIGICISKIHISDDFLSKFGLIIEKLKYLKFVLIEAYNNHDALNNIVRSILKNTSLNILVFAGFSLEVSQIIEYKQVQRYCKQLKYFEFLKEFKF